MSLRNIGAVFRNDEVTHLKLNKYYCTELAALEFR